MQHTFAHVHGLAVFILGVSAFTAHAAGTNKPSADPSDANATVPLTRYASFLTTPPPPRGSSPADNWKALNRAVTSSGTMSHEPPEPVVPTAPPAEATAPKPPPGAPHAGHEAQSQNQPDPHAHHRPGVAK